MTNILELPEDCVARILSLTSPKDVLRSSAVSKQFLTASRSDTVWAKLLSSADVAYTPSSSEPYGEYTSKKDIYLCRYPILLENDTMSYAFDKWTRKVSYTLGSKALSIYGGNNRGCWSWNSADGSWFPECAVMECVCLLEIKGKIPTVLLSSDTTYGAYFVYRIITDHYSSTFSHTLMSVSISETSDLDLSPKYDRLFPKYKEKLTDDCTPETRSCYLSTPNPGKNAEVLPEMRRDGWMEVEMGRYRVGVKGKCQSVVLEMTLKDCMFGHYRTGLIIHGIELRPLHVTRKQLMYDQLSRLLHSKMRP